MDTPNAGIPYVPEDTQDPAAGLNLALNVIDALLQTAVISMALTAPPGSPADGDLYIVGASATGDWAGQDNSLARWVEDGEFWQFYAAGSRAKLVLNLADGGLYAWNGSAWVAPVAAGSVAADAVSYDNTVSELVATQVQDAIDELAAEIEAIEPGAGDVVGPASSTDNTLPRFNGSGGKTLQGSGVAVSDNNEISGYRGHLNQQTGTTYTLQLSDSGKIVELTNAAAIALTADPTLPPGFACTVVQGGAGQVTIASSGSGSVVNRQSQFKTAGANAVCGVYVRSNSGSNAVFVFGGDTAP